MCKSRFVLLLLLLSSFSWSEPLQDSSDQDFSSRLSAALDEAVPTLSPKQAKLLMPVFQIYDKEIETLSDDLKKEREKRELDSLRIALEAAGVGFAAGAVVVGSLWLWFLLSG